MTAAARRRRLSLRRQLTLVWAGLFALFGAALLAITYLLVRQSLLFAPGDLQGVVERRLGLPPGSLDGLEPVGAGAPDSLFQQLQRELVGVVLEELLLQSLLVLAVSVVLAAVLGWLVASRIVRPVREITSTARQLSVATLDRRIGMAGPADELRELADTFDAMLDRLDAAFASQRRFVADASHELRTPLSVIAAELDVTLADPDASVNELRRMAGTIRAATTRSERLIDGLLALALADSGVAVRTDERADLAELARAGAAGRAQAWADRRLTLDLALEPAVVVGDAALLERLVENLVGNAAVHTPEGGRVLLRTGTGTGTDAGAGAGAGGKSDRVVQVRTSAAPHWTTSGLDVEQLFRPFQRGSRERTGSARGSGLGLAIVRSIARAHGGEASARLTEDQHFEVTVRLPPPDAV